MRKIIGLVFVLLIILLYIPQPEDEYVYETTNTQVELSNINQFKMVHEKILTSQTAREPKITSNTMQGLKFKQGTSQRSIELNTKALEIADYYYNPETMGYINPHFIDAKFLLALSNIEWPGSFSTDVIWSGALPTKYLDENNWTADYMQRVSIADFISYETFWDKMDSHQGPFQMTVDYGVKYAAIPDLQGTEKGELSSISNLPNYVLSNTNYFDSSLSIPTGDRYNWADSCNRTAGVFNMMMKQYIAKSSVTKTGEYSIDNPYQLMALLAMGHNAGASAVYGDDEFIPEASWWVFKETKNCRLIAHQIGTGEPLDDVKQKAKDAIKSYREGGVLRIQMTWTEAYPMYEDWLNKGLVTFEPDNTSESKSRIGYPIQTLYAYFVLCELYGGE